MTQPDIQLLHQLLQASDFVPHDQLIRDRPSTDLRQTLNNLTHAGCRLDEHPQRGIRLLQTGLGVWADYLQSRQHADIIEIYRQTHSTQDVARRLIQTLGPRARRAIAIADEQRAGRGRLGRAWISPPGSAALFSRATIETAGQRTVDQLMLIAAVGVAQGIENACRQRVSVNIKWPNDLLINQRKVAGILLETQTLNRNNTTLHAAILGVGINVNHSEKQLDDLHANQPITSLANAGCNVDRLRVIDAVLHAIQHANEQPGQNLLDQWRQRCVTLTQHVRLQNDGRTYEGRVIDLDLHHGLILRTHTGNIIHLPAATTTRL